MLRGQRAFHRRVGPEVTPHTITSRAMSKHVGIRFRIGDLFPADDPLARWLTGCMAALNDLLLVNGWLIPRLESDGPHHVNVYLGRLGASHVFEVAKFLHHSERRVPQVRTFLDGLNADARAAYERVKAVGPAGTEPFAGQLEHARDHFFHYAALVPHAPDHEKLKQAMHEHATPRRHSRPRADRRLPRPVRGRHFRRTQLPRERRRRARLRDDVGGQDLRLPRLRSRRPH